MNCALDNTLTITLTHIELQDAIKSYVAGMSGDADIRSQLLAKHLSKGTIDVRSGGATLIFSFKRG